MTGLEPQASQEIPGDNLPAKPQASAHKIDPKKDGPKVGEWYWVLCKENNKGENTKKTQEHLFCVQHLASNHVRFARSTRDGSESWISVRYRDLASTVRLEPNWREIIQQQIGKGQKELQDAVRALSDAVGNADLLPEQGEGASGSMLPTRTRYSPEERKKSLLKLKDKDFPRLHKEVEHITQEITARHRDLMLPMKIQAKRMSLAVEKVDERLFALELYAGLFQKCKQIRSGKPAPAETPITVRQMLRYMDEECLIDYDGGGMGYDKLEDFDEWVIEDKNLNNIAPEPRCIVALKIRRHPKDYGPIQSIAEIFSRMEKHDLDSLTYLLLRNGEQVFRLACDISFEPRLLPYRDEFTKPFTNSRRNWDTHSDEEEPVSPDDLDYDEHTEKRKAKIYKYNRVMFLVQGLLDRSKVFSPHPPINLGDDEHIAKYFHAVYDEELGLPSANPPKWEDYRDKCNASIKPGSYIWSDWHGDGDYEYSRYDRKQVLRKSRDHDLVCVVDRVSRDKSKVLISWPWGTRWGYEHRDRWGSCYGKFGEWEVKRRHRMWIPTKELIHLNAYKPGDFKQFLCDAYLKAAYAQWAKPLLNAEKWHKEQKTKSEKSSKAS